MARKQKCSPTQTFFDDALTVSDVQGPVCQGGVRHRFRVQAFDDCRRSGGAIVKSCG